MEIPGLITLEDYVQAFLTAEAHETYGLWEQADVANAFLEGYTHKWGRRLSEERRILKEFADKIGKSVSTVVDLAKTAKVFKPEQRRLTLAFSIYRACAKTSQPVNWLSKAIVGNWSVSELRKWIHVSSGRSSRRVDTTPWRPNDSIPTTETLLPQPPIQSFYGGASEEDPELQLQWYAELQRARARESLRSQLQAMSPRGFEDFVGKLLEAMGCTKVEVTGRRRRHGGIDGQALDPLLAETVVFQAKRWTRPIPGDDIAAFKGRVMGRFGRGYFITISSFTSGAAEVFEEAGDEKIILIDGDKLTDLMIEKGLGVEERPLAYWHVNEDFFSPFR